MGHVLDVRQAHHAGAVDRDVHEDAVEIDILLGVRVDQVVEVMPGDGEHRLAIHLGVVQAIEQMDAAGADVARQTPSLPVNLA